MGKKSRGHQQERRQHQANFPTIGNLSLSFIDFYKAILVPTQMSEEEFQSMLDYYRKPLPQVFRLSQSAQNHQRLETELNKFFQDIKSKQTESKPGEKSFDLSEYSCFPSQYGRVFKIEVDKTLVRKLPELENFNSWLRFNTDIGNCHRQEFVSMIPPIFMDVQSNASVLDTCAAPGSKTAQIMEMISTETRPMELPSGVTGSPYGYVVANDSDAKRCHNLVHQLQRIGIQNVIITCQNAAKFEFADYQFDRVLCDVPCTGDGTIRKNSEAGSRWSIFPSINLHMDQKQILIRGLELVKKNGLCVYSTCSMNPIEDEAVISEVIQTIGQDKVEIVDCSALYPDMKRHPGISSWPHIVEAAQNAHKEKLKRKSDQQQGDEEASTNDEANVPNEIAEKGIHVEAQCNGIEHCMRFYPQDHDSGGFFVAVLRKLDDFDRITEPKPAKELKEAAYRPVQEASPKALAEIYKMYGIKKEGEATEEELDDSIIEVNPNQFFTRSENKMNKVYYMSQPIADIISKYGSEALHTVSAGIPVFNYKQYSKASEEIPYPSQEGIDVVFQMATTRKYALTPIEMKKLLSAGNEGLKITQMDAERQKIFDNQPRTAALFYIKDSKFMYGGHLGKNSLIVYLKKELVQYQIKELAIQFPEINE